MFNQSSLLGSIQKPIWDRAVVLQKEQKRKESKISRKTCDLNREELIKKNKLTKIDVNK